MWHSFSDSVLNGGRAWLACVLLLCGIQTTRQIYTAQTDAPTYDEGVHLNSGYTFLKTGQYKLNPEHPPLVPVLAALPLLWLNLDPHLSTPRRDHFDGGAKLLFGQPNLSPIDVLFPARRVVIGFTLILGLTIAFWTRARFSPFAGLIAVCLFTLDPNISAHGHYVTTDIAAVLGSFLAVVAFERLLRNRTWLDVLWAGLALGFALSVKFSTLFLFPVLALLWILRGRTLRAFAIVPVAAGVILASYGGQFQYLDGLLTMLRHQVWGHESFLLGTVRDRGVWYYFPIVFAVKTPLAALLLLPLMRGPHRDWLVLVVPMAVYWVISLISGVNIGLRHILPVFPFTYALIGAGVAGWRKPVLLLCAALALESALIFPYDLSFFNVAAGGPSNGMNILADSNIDWGQDLIRAQQHFGPATKDVCFAYFGTAEKAYYGFPPKDVPTTEMIRAGERPDCRYVAISVTRLQGVYRPRKRYDWLRERTPIARIGYSILVYDVSDIRAN